MRNIEFEESTVLNEFAKLIKEADDKKSNELKSTNMMEARKKVGAIIKKTSRVLSWLYAGKKLSVRAAMRLATEIFRKNIMATVLKSIQLEKDLAVQTHMLYIYKNLVVAIRKALIASDIMDKNSLAAVMKKIPTASASTKKQSPKVDIYEDTDISGTPSGYRDKADDGLVGEANIKEAAEKVYDVTGETGEQIVERAHPGGGTKTEVSSKTTENLIETIVEQQDRDVSVVKKMPKGTYAVLKKLYDDLSKMGHQDKLSDLADMIKSAADVTEQAGELQKVKAQIKTETNNLARENVESGNKYLDAFIVALGKMGIGEKSAAHLIKAKKGLKNKGLFYIQRALAEWAKQYPAARKAGLLATNTGKMAQHKKNILALRSKERVLERGSAAAGHEKKNSKINNLSKEALGWGSNEVIEDLPLVELNRPSFQERIEKIKSKENPGFGEIDVSSIPDDQGAADVNKKREQRRKVANWQRRYNNAVRGTKIFRLVVDGIWGKKTQMAYRLIKKKDGWANFNKITQKIRDRQYAKKQSIPQPFQPSKPAFTAIRSN